MVKPGSSNREGNEATPIEVKTMKCRACRDRQVKMATHMSLRDQFLIEMVEMIYKLQVRSTRRRQIAQGQGLVNRWPTRENVLRCLVGSSRARRGLRAQQSQYKSELHEERLTAPNVSLLSCVVSVSNAGETRLREGRSNNLLPLVDD